MARPWRRNGGGRPEEGGVAQRLGEGAPCPPPFSRSSPPCPPPGSPPVFPAWGRRRRVPRRPLVVPCPWSPPSRAPPSLRRAGRGWGGARVLPRLRPRRRSSPGRLGASRDVRRSGGPPWRLPGSGLPVPRGGTSEPRLTWGACRPPPPAASPGRFRPGPSDVRADPALPLRVSPSPPAPPPRPRARVRLLSFLRLRSTSRAPCPLVPRFPPQPPRPLWREGPGSRVRGGTGRG